MTAWKEQLCLEPPGSLCTSLETHRMAREHRNQSPCRVATPHHHHAWHPGGSDLGPWSPDRLTSAPLGPSGCQSHRSDYRLKSLSRCLQRVYQSYFRGKQCDVKASLVAQMVKNLSAMQQTQVQSLTWEDPLEKGMATFGLQGDPTSQF